MMDLEQGKGMKLVLVLTADDGNALGEGLQRAIDDLGMGKKKANEASDEYAYVFQVYDVRTDMPMDDDTYDEYGVNTKNSFNTPPKEVV
jgi:hypothetical protein